MYYILMIDDQSAGVASTTFVTREQAIAIMAMAPGDAVQLDDDEITNHIGEPGQKDPLIEFVSRGVRPSARRSRLLPQLQAIRDGKGVPADD
ncbi:hypothetical protein [Sphingomonas sp. T9W2]|uniref:hypothetical protein n=1 Tax=Sphingomonas sp. T9W2 TaxID=3143183 RepID=UPI0031F4FF03